MLKLLYKTLLISVISGSLSIMNMVAFAQDTKATTKASATGYTRDASGVYTKTESHNMKGNKGEDDNALHIITMLAVAVVGMKLLMYKKWTLDMSIVAVACAAYIAAEIVNIMNLKKQIEDMNVQVTKRSDGKIDQTQIETIQKLKESYEAAKDAIKTRKMLQSAAGVAFVAATAVAGFQYFTTEGQFASCMAGIESAEAKLTACVATGTLAAATVVEANEAKACGLCKIEVSQLLVSVPANHTAAQYPQISMYKEVEMNSKDLVERATITKPCPTGVQAASAKAMIQGSCEAYALSKNAVKAFGDFAKTVYYQPNFINNLLFKNATPVLMSVDQSIASRNVLQKIVDFVLPNAEAGMVALLGLSAAAGATFLTVARAEAQIIDKVMFTPGGRIIAWGIMSTAAFLGAQASQDEMDKIDGHIADIDRILKDMNNLQNGIKANNINEQQIKLAAFQANQAEAIKLNSNSAVKTDCLTSSGSNNCTPLSSQIKSMPGFAELPDSFKTIASQSATLGDGLSGTNSISGSTISAAGALVRNQNAIGKLAANIKSKINDTLAKDGKPKIDFDKEESKLLNQMKVQTAKALSGSGMSAGSFLASTGISPFDNAKAAIAKISSGKKSTNLGGDTPAASAAAGAKKDKDLDFNFKEAQGEAALGMAGGAGAAKEKEAKYDIGENDINTNSGESIFQVISNRYIKSGYPKLLDEIPLPVKK